MSSRMSRSVSRCKGEGKLAISCQRPAKRAISSWGTAFITVGVVTDRATLTLSVAGSGRDQVMARFPRTGGQPVGPVLPAKAVPTSVGFDRPLDGMRSLLQDIGTERDRKSVV